VEKKRKIRNSIVAITPEELTPEEPAERRRIYNKEKIQAQQGETYIDDHLGCFSV
jgi:hypothetical protein